LAQVLARPLEPFLHIAQQFLDDFALYKSQEIDLMRTGELPNQVVTSLQYAQARFGKGHEVRKPENFHSSALPYFP
jgi:hypothetical protein